MKALGKAIKKSVKDRETSWGKSLVVLGWLLVFGFAASVVLPLAVAVLVPWFLTKFLPVKDTQRKAAVVGLALVVVVAAGYFLGGEIFTTYLNFAGQLRGAALNLFGEWPGVFDWRGLALPGLAASIAYAVGAVHHKNDKPLKRKQVGGAQLAKKPGDIPELVAGSAPVKDRPIIGFPIWSWAPGQVSVLEKVLKHPKGPERDKAEQRAEKALSRRRPLLSTTEDNGLIIGPTGSGKTTGILVPLVVSPAYASANMIVSSVKGDVFDATVALRRRSGTIMVYDPFGVVPGADPYRVKWSPLLSCGTWKGSMRVANSLISHAGLGSRNDGAYFENQAKTTLAPLLYAAHLTGESLTTLMAWLGRFQQNPLDKTIPDILQKAQEQGLRDAEQALNAWMMAAGNSSSTTGSQPFQTISSALACFRSQEVLDAAELSGAVFDPREFVRNQGGATLYLVIPDSDQDLLRPVLTALVTEIFQAGVDYATACGGALPEKLVTVLDEMAVGTPLPQLPELLATCRSRNITVWHAWQDAAQIRSVYGEKAQTVLNNSLVRMFLPGSADRTTLELVTFLGGQAELEKVTVSERDGESSESRTTSSEALMPADVVRQLPRGTGLLFYGNRKPAMVDLPMSFLFGPLRSQPAPDIPVPRQQIPTYTPKPPVVTLTAPESFAEAYAGVTARIDTALGRTVEKDPSEMMIFDWLDDGGS